jgi:phosphate transport system protein
MALYEKRLQDDLNHIREQIHAMGDQTEKALVNAVHALLMGDQKLANETVLADHPINRRMREIDRLCHGFIARHLPSAGHLRLISSIIRINIQLERIGDYTVTIAREGLQLAQPLEGIMAHEVESIANEVKHIFHQALSAFYDESADIARATMQMPANLQFTMDGIYANLMSGEHTRDSKEMFAVSVILSQLKRVADQAKNICEETLFALTGETKAKKVYNILFVDKENASLSQMAEAIAKKNFPNSGDYRSAGKEPAAEIDSEMAQFLDRYGLDLSSRAPIPLELAPQELANFHVIVSLQGPANAYISSIPFHTSYLEWNLGRPPTGMSEDESARRYEEIYRELSCQIKELMELLRGEGAD